MHKPLNDKVKGITDSKYLRQGSDASTNNRKIISRGYA